MIKDGHKNSHPRTRIFRSSYILAAALVTAWLTRSMHGTVPYSDDYEMIVESRGLLHGIFQVEFGWFCPIQKFVYSFLATTWGFHTYLPYRMAGLALVLATGLLFGKRLAKHSPGIGLIGAIWMMTMPGAFHTYLWPAASWTLVGLIGLLFLEQFEDLPGAHLTRDDVVAVVVSSLTLLASGPMGIPFVIAIAVLRWRRESWRPTFLTTLPLVLYALIVFIFDNSSVGSRGTPLSQNFLASGNYVVKSIAAASSTLVGDNAFSVVPILAMPMLYLRAVHHFSHQQRRFHLATVTSALSYMFILALWRGHLGEPGAPRYTIVGAFALLLLIADSVAALWNQLPSLQIKLLGLIGSLIFLSANAWTLELRTNDFQYLANVWGSRLAAVELVRDRLPETFALDATNLPQFDLTTYLNAISDKGSLAKPLAALSKSDQTTEKIAEEVLSTYSSWSLDVSPEQTGCAVTAHNRSSGNSSRKLNLVNDSSQPAHLDISWLTGDPLWTFIVPAQSKVHLIWNGTTVPRNGFKWTSDRATFCSK